MNRNIEMIIKIYITKILDIRSKYSKYNIILNKNQTSLKSLLSTKLSRIRLNNLVLFSLTTNKSKIKSKTNNNSQKLRDWRMLLMKERKMLIKIQIKLFSAEELLQQTKMNLRILRNGLTLWTLSHQCITIILRTRTP